MKILLLIIAFTEISQSQNFVSGEQKIEEVFNQNCAPGSYFWITCNLSE